ncbi:aminotransferase class III-fold pyridoxal phosphate-dependent enzyme [Rhizobium sp. C1]|uniref:aminotransferase class III-fold pyridoxal phosphate-dependent enzyme n=1 Tax=Rhizobium sp. C1 TaxID=1349799 RepID=UPI001E339F2D|nr:aminotransferase class III-fold pyridoxal phosphate-dependent enzyme [Rhizobium sp. C1]MCD2177932.1 aminotransferase class III-fold pyridoxal phosphate-dependent enzyme [Rhizobium sp. C1]
MNAQQMMMDPILEAMLAGIKAPNLPLELIEKRVAQVYGLSGAWQKLGGEREQNFRLATEDGASFVVKIAAPTEPLESLLFQTEALEHIARVDADYPVPRLRRTLAGEAMSHILDEAGASHVLRVLTFVKGEILFDQVRETGRSLGAEDLVALGRANGRLARALQGFAGRGASSVMPWDIRSGLLFSPALHAHMPASLAPLLNDLLPQISEVLTNRLPKLRAQVIYNDFHESNVLVKFDPSLTVEGVIDFGDMIFGPVAQDLAVSIASLIHWTPDPVFAAHCLVRGYQRFMPLEQDDLVILRSLVLARLLLQVGLVSYQKTVHGRDDADLDALQALYIQAVLKIKAVSDADFIKGVMPSVVPVSQPVAASPTAPTPALVERRQAVLGKTYMFYNEPLELVRGRGCMVYDAAGNEYLDCYNNVANVGHCHPYVLDALMRQAAALNTNSRYLHPEIVRLGERLSATLPAHLDTLVFVCTGSEANDLAVRMARLISGNEGVVITENSYHGNTTTVAPLSLIDYDIKDKPNWVATVPPPNLYRGLYRQDVNDAGAKYADHVTQAARKLAADGPGMAALMIDSIFDANGALVPPPDYMPLAYQAAKTAGALVIADEVQMGFARSGTHMWGFEAFGVQPDIVTMGKPMGNGHPVAAVATRREIAEVLQKQTGYFNTFGGNTVSAAVANACLDVLIGEDLQGNAARSGAWLLKELDALMQRHEIIGHIQGRGLFLGVELVTDRTTRGPAKFAARWVRERMKTLGVLVSSTGPHGNIIKIRPPLVFSVADAVRCVEALDRALGEVPADLRSVAV